MKIGSLVKRIRDGQLGIVTDVTVNPHQIRFIHVRWKRDDGSLETPTVERRRVFEVIG